MDPFAEAFCFRYYSSCQVTRKNAKLAAVTAKSESIEDMDGEREGCSADGAGEGSGAGGGAFAPQYGVELSKEERHGVVLDEVRRCVKPDGEFGENAARLFQKMLRRGNSLNGTGPTLQDAMQHLSDVNLLTELKMTFAGKTVKLLAMGITHLDGDELLAAILRAPSLCVAADESMRHGEKKYPIFVAFCDVARRVPWWGVFRVCVMNDKTAETQAQLFYDTIVNVWKYPRERVHHVLSDNTASVSGKVGGCVALLQRKLKGEDTTEKTTSAGACAGRGRAARGGQGSQGGVARGGRGSRGLSLIHI